MADFRPSIVVAGAAIGGSHIVASTKAGALYGSGLIAFIILVNLIKLPFFWFAQRYTAVSQQSVLAGYRQLGRGYLWLFLLMTALTGIVAIAGAPFNRALLTLIFPGLNPKTACGLVMVVLAGVVAFGHYHLVDRMTKWLVVVLVAPLRQCLLLLAMVQLQLLILSRQTLGLLQRFHF